MRYFLSHVLDSAPFAALGALACFWIRSARQRKRGERGRLPRELAIALFVGYLVGLWALTLTPHNLIRDFWYYVRFHVPPRPEGLSYYAPMLDPSQWLFSTRLNNLLGSREALSNLALFLPFGVFVPLLWPRRRWLTPLLGFSLSLAVELLQMPLRRAADLRDLLMNAAGVCVGLLVSALLRRIAPGFARALAPEL